MPRKTAPSKKTKRIGNMFENVHVEHLLVVTGPTSSGKSTLLALIENGSVEGDILSVLPENVFGWKQFCHREYDGTLASTKDNPLKGLILHYDFMRPFKKFLKGYEDDVISTLIDRASKVTILIIKTDAGVLLEQLKKGELDGKALETAPANQALRKLFTRTLHIMPSGIRSSIKKKLFPNRKMAVTDFNKVLYFKYQEQGWVDDWYHKFDRFLDDKVLAGADISRHFVQAARDKRKEWKVLQ